MVLGAGYGLGQLGSVLATFGDGAALGLVMGASGQLGDGGAPASLGDKSCPLLSALPTVSVSRVRVAIGRMARRGGWRPLLLGTSPQRVFELAV